MAPLGWRASLALALLSLAFWIVTLTVDENEWIDAFPPWLVGTAFVVYLLLAIGRYRNGPE